MIIVCMNKQPKALTHKGEWARLYANPSDKDSENIASILRKAGYSVITFNVEHKIMPEVVFDGKTYYGMESIRNLLE